MARRWTGRAREFLPRAPIKELLERLFEERNDDPLADQEQRRKNGRQVLVQELVASGKFTKEGANRRLYSILSGEQKHVERGTAEKLLAALDLNHLWYTEPSLRRLMPKPERPSAEEAALEHDSTCGKCGRAIDWSKPLPGVRVELRFRGRGRQPAWWSWCAICACEELPVASRPDVTARKTRKIPDDEVRRLYKLYVTQDVGVQVVAEQVYRQYGYKSVASCASALTHVWRETGLPIRTRWQSKVANRELRPRLGKLTKEQVEQAYVIYTRAGLSFNELGKRLYRRLGYKTHHSAAVALSKAFQDMGFEARERIEATVLASTKNGLSPRDWSERKRRRLEAGLTQHGNERQPKCAGTTAKGTRCGRPSTKGSDYCPGHDPAKAQARAERLAAMRQRSPRQNPANLTTYGEIRPDLEAFIEWAGGRMRAAELLAERLQINPYSVLRYFSFPPEQRLTLDKARQLREAIAAVTAPAAAA